MAYVTLGQLTNFHCFSPELTAQLQSVTGSIPLSQSSSIGVAQKSCVVDATYSREPLLFLQCATRVSQVHSIVSLILHGVPPVFFPLSSPDFSANFAS